MVSARTICWGSARTDELRMKRGQEFFLSAFFVLEAPAKGNSPCIFQQDTMQCFRDTEAIGRAQGMAVPRAPMQETHPPTQQVYCAHSSLYPVPAPFSRVGIRLVVCAASGGVGTDSLRRFCCLNGIAFRGPGGEAPGAGPLRNNWEADRK